MIRWLMMKGYMVKRDENIGWNDEKIRWKDMVKREDENIGWWDEKRIIKKKTYP